MSHLPMICTIMAKEREKQVEHLSCVHEMLLENGGANGSGDVHEAERVSLLAELRHRMHGLFLNSGRTGQCRK